MTAAWPAIVTLLNVLLLIWTMFMVGGARRRYGIAAPATTGNPDFERVFRVQMNTLESTVMFQPCLWLAAVHWNAYYAGYVGLAWIVGRVLYAHMYARAAQRRSAGFGIAFLANILLFGAAAWGLFAPLF
jgi:glutathione S-transferase